MYWQLLLAFATWDLIKWVSIAAFKTYQERVAKEVSDNLLAKIQSIE